MTDPVGNYVTGDIPVFHDPESPGARFGGFIGHPNFAAYMLLITLLMVAADKDLGKTGRLFLLAVLSAGAVLTASRIAFVACCLGLLIIGVRNWKILFGLIGASFLLLATSSTLLQRTTSFQSSGGLQGSNTLTFRLQQWREALALHAWHAPFGIGWNRTAELLPDRLAAHGGYVQVVVELGLVGVLGLLLWIAAIVMVSVRVGRVGLAVIVFLLVSNITDPTILYPPIAYAYIVGLFTFQRDARARYAPHAPVRA